MAEPSRRRKETARGATDDGSRRSGAENALQAAPLLVLALGLAGALLLVVTEFTAVATVDVASGSCEVIQDTDPELADRCELSGLERNGGAFVLLAVLAALMAWGAGPGRSRPAAVALIVIGGLVLLWALLVDLPVTDETGAIGNNFEGAEATAGPGLTLEIGGGLLTLAAGLAGVVAWRPGSLPPRAPRRG